MPSVPACAPVSSAGLRELPAVLAPAELRVGEVALVAVREAEVLALLRDVVERIVGQILAEPVAAVVGVPELAVLRIEVEADGVAHAQRDVLDAAAVEVHARDLGEAAAGSQMLHGAPIGT